MLTGLGITKPTDRILYISYFKRYGKLTFVKKKNLWSFETGNYFEMRLFWGWIYHIYVCMKKRHRAGCLYSIFLLISQWLWCDNTSIPINSTVQWQLFSLLFSFLSCISTGAGSLGWWVQRPYKVQALSQRSLRCVLFFCLWSFSAGCDWEVILQEG